jgi:predicted RNA binding protein YcfA (HicA-like mRNA interferase family)
MTKDLRQLVRRAERLGWEVAVTNGGHLRWTGPDGQAIVITAATPHGGSRTHRNTVALLRRAGLDLSTEGRKAA